MLACWKGERYVGDMFDSWRERETSKKMTKIMLKDHKGEKKCTKGAD